MTYNYKAAPFVDPTLYKIAMEFMGYTNDVLGAYLDSLAGLSCLREKVVRFQEATIEQLKHSSPADASEQFMDEQPLSHEFEADPPKVLHRRTQGEFKERTKDEGGDARMLGCMAITLLYGSWEDVFRKRLANAMGCSRNDLKSDVFGDLGKLRHAIVHNHGQATSDVEAAKILKWFRRGQTIFISPSRINHLLDYIDAYVTQLCGMQPDANNWSLPEHSPTTTHSP